MNLAYRGNGDLTSVSYAVTGGRSGGMALSYDRAGRLLSASGSGGFAQHTEDEISYDANGNLTALRRQRPGAIFDQLSYVYTGNRLRRVNDSGGSEGFVNGADGDNELRYDGAGNLVADDNRGLGVSYNALGLVRQTSQPQGQQGYVYDGSGTKRRLEWPGQSTLYEGAFEYNGGTGQLTRIGLEEGQLVRNANGSYVVHYYLRDHLGNVRAVVDEGGSLVQETEYYAFGYALSRSGEGVNMYGYNQKERQPLTGWLDYGARQYDPTLGRWSAVDPLSEVSRRFSPYVYGNNNPLRFIDPDGMMAQTAYESMKEEDEEKLKKKEDDQRTKRL